MILALAAPFVYSLRKQWSASTSAPPQATFVGSKTCKTCHPSEYNQWKGSDHDLAMAEANEQTVFGDFSNVTYHDPHSGKDSRFFLEDGKYKVQTEGPDGDAGTFTITHTFGHYPLQQYLVPFPGGRLQCLPVAWDRDKKQWYRLPPYDVKGPGDWLHWTRGGQTWNGMCAECHSTVLQKQYHIDSDSYTTGWFEINVGCEACHGPSSQHLAWAERPAMARKQTQNYGLQFSTSDLAPERQIVLCAPCHARRYQLGDNTHDNGELLDIMVPSLLSEDLYHTDGQIKEEVYVYGSFTQSKMYHRGVRCSDCHNMHSLKPLLDHETSNALCLQCHQKTVYDSYSHHFHKDTYKGKPSKGKSCVKCHMPGKYYMGIDYRPDHSLRIPRPDLSLKLDTPNSCSTVDCHGDKPLSWVIEHYGKWYGQARKPHYGEILALGRSGAPDAAQPLRDLVGDGLQPAIVRATGLLLLSGYPDSETQQTILQTLDSDEALLRHTALRILDHPDEQVILQCIAPKLYDPVKAVRLEAAVKLSQVPTEKIREQDQETLAATLEEYRNAMRYNGDFAPQRYNLGNIESRQGNKEAAIELYREALEIDDQFVPAKVNLAMELNTLGKNGEAEQLFREVIASHPEMHHITYSLGLLLAEMQKYEEAAQILAQAAQGLPGNSRIQYNLALVTLKLQRYEEGSAILERLVEKDPDDQHYFVTLANLYMSFSLYDRVRMLAEKVLQQNPEHQQAKELLRLLDR